MWFEVPRDFFNLEKAQMVKKVHGVEVSASCNRSAELVVLIWSLLRYSKAQLLLSGRKRFLRFSRFWRFSRIWRSL